MGYLVSAMHVARDCFATWAVDVMLCHGFEMDDHAESSARWLDSSSRSHDSLFLFHDSSLSRVLHGLRHVPGLMCGRESHADPIPCQIPHLVDQIQAAHLFAFLDAGCEVFHLCFERI